MFNIFRKRSSCKDLEWLGVDLHSHLIPGIDDGVKDAKTSVDFIQELQLLGIQRFIMTPHVYDEVHPNTPESIFLAHELLKEELLKRGLTDLPTHAAAEYMLGQRFLSVLETGELMSLPDQHLLIEMPYIAEPLQLEQMVFQIIVSGFKPIMAHPERYVFYFNKPNAYHKLKEMGCLLQLNLLSSTGYYGKEVAKAAAYLIKNELYDLAGTDLHHERHLNRILKYVQSGKAYNELGHLGLKNRELFCSF